MCRACNSPHLVPCMDSFQVAKVFVYEGKSIIDCIDKVRIMSYSACIVICKNTVII